MIAIVKEGNLKQDSCIYNYKPKESSLQRQILNDIISTDSPFKEQAISIKNEAQSFLLRPQRTQSERNDEISVRGIQNHHVSQYSDSMLDQNNDSFTKFNRNKRNILEQQRSDRKMEQSQLKKEASQLIQQIKQQKEQSDDRTRQKVRKILDKQFETYNKATSQLETIKLSSIDPSGYLDAIQIHNKSLNKNDSTKVGVLSKLTPQRLRWKPKIPLYKEIESRYQIQLVQNEIMAKKQMQRQKYHNNHMNIQKDQHKAYDSLLKERAYKIDQNMFGKSPRQKKDSMNNLLNQDLDLEASIYNYKQSKHIQRNQNVKDQRKIKNEFEKEIDIKKQKEQRRYMYAEYVKEINLPLELDREGLKQEATRQRLQQQLVERGKSVKHISSKANQIQEMKTNSEGRKTALENKRRNHQQSFPSILIQDKSQSYLPSPKGQESHLKNQYQTPNSNHKQHPQWAQEFLKKNDYSLSKHEKVGFVMTNANVKEEQASRIEQNIKMKGNNMKYQHDFDQRANEIIAQQQNAGDKLVDAIRAKLALLDVI